MLNPSTADAQADDPTIRRCLGFVRDLGGTHLTVVNLFAYRATDPRDLAQVADQDFLGAVGSENDTHIEREIRRHQKDRIIAAWGAHRLAPARGLWLTRKFGPIRCLGTTNSGAPRHPLYLHSGAQPVEFRA